MRVGYLQQKLANRAGWEVRGAVSAISRAQQPRVLRAQASASAGSHRTQPATSTSAGRSTRLHARTMPRTPSLNIQQFYSSEGYTKSTTMRTHAGSTPVTNMWLLFLLCLTISASASGYLKTFRKCCEKHQSLKKVIGSEINNSTEYFYECLDRDSGETLNVDFSRSTIFVSEGVIVEYGMPIECDLEMVQFEDNDIRISEDDNHCYDRLVVEDKNGTLKQIVPKTVALICKGTTLLNEKKVKIQNIRKCCPPGQTYDTVNHECRIVGGDIKISEDLEKQWFLKQLTAYDGKVFEFETGLYCKSSEYSVELKDDLFSLTMEGSTLKILKHLENNAALSPAGNWCVDREHTSRRLVARVCTQDCSQFGAFCFNKCCPLGQHYKPFHCGTFASACVPNNDVIFYNFSEYVDPVKNEYGLEDTVGIRLGITCPFGKTLLNKTAHYDRHHLTRDGMLTSVMGTGHDYCLEMFDLSACSTTSYVTGVICFQEIQQVTKNFQLSFVLNTISAVCLALTLVVYCAIKELRNLHGRNLICHVSMMLLAYSCLARAQFNFVGDKNLCAALAYGIYFGFVAAFVWLNVMCFDIWWTFGSVRTVQTLNKGKATRRRFLWYSLYAWGTASAVTLTMFLLDRFPVAEELDANMGVSMCWFGSEQNTEKDWPHYIFFVIPMGLVTCANFVLWLLTARYCSRVKSEVHRLQAGSVGDRAKRRFRVDKANLMLTGKLWVVMGAGWSSELLSTLASSNSESWFWVIVDLINELQGVFIFIILVFKPKLYYLIRKRLGLEKPDAQKNGNSSTARTSSTFFSRTTSTDERAIARVSVPNDNAKHA